MAKLNVRQPNTFVTHEGSPAKRIDAEATLRRSLMSCLLWEGEFYEDGQTIAQRLCELVPLVEPEAVAQMAIEAREKMKLRHAPLLIVREMARYKTHRKYVANCLSSIIQRADELAEFLALYWKDGKQPLSAQVKKGLAIAFNKFDAYQLAKYNRDGAVKLRDVLFLCHAKPKDEEQDIIWKKLIDSSLESPDTWEVSLSAGKDKAETFSRLLKENKLGGLAVLRNLRNMQSAGVDPQLISDSILKMKTDKILPFRFIAAARYAPTLEQVLEDSLFKCTGTLPKLMGHTVILADVSGSMDNPISAKSDMKRDDAAYGLAMIAREICEQVSIYTFSSILVQIPARHGMALRDAMRNSQHHGSTYLGQALNAIPVNYDRIIVITDEQSHDTVPNPKAKGYMINVASNRNGVGYGRWIHIDGFSEAVFNYITEIEKEV